MSGSLAQGERVEVAVVGAGLMGAATAWALARRGVSVALFEAREPGHRAGSSHGSARIFRRAYADPLYIGMTGRAGELWRELERDCGESLLRVTGGLDHGQDRDPAGLAGALAAAGVPVELLPAEEASRRWPGYAFTGQVMYHAEAGVIDADRAVGAMIAGAVRRGARWFPRTPVTRVEAVADGARLHLADADSADSAAGAGRAAGEGSAGGEGAEAGDGFLTGAVVAADRVVVAVGAWLPELLGGVLDLPPLIVTQEQIFHFPRREPGTGEWPIFVYKGEDGMAYGLPGGRDGGPGGAIKVAEHHGGPRTTAEHRDGVVDPASRQRVIELVRRHLPGLVPAPFAEATCLYTTTVNEDFILDRVGPIVVCSPCSGHGAKFTPLIGELAADLAQGGDPPSPRFTLAAHRRAATAHSL